MKPPRSVLLAATLGVCAGVAGCSANEDPAPVQVVLASGSQLADAPSAFIVRVASASGGDEVRAVATHAVMVEAGGLVLLDDALPPGRYRLEASQQGCGMDGDECPDDSSSSAFVGAQTWQCSVTFEATSSRRTRIEIVETPDEADQKVGRVVT